MKRMHWCYAWFEHLPLRWRLALLSFGLLAILMGGFGLLISVTEENNLLATQANVLNNQAQIVQASLNATMHKDKHQMHEIPLPADDLSSPSATDLLKTVGEILGRNANIAL